MLAYSESLESVSLTSTSPEVWRNLGYWLTYVRDAYAATTTAARDYMVSGRLIATGFVVLLVGLAGLVATRWRDRVFAVALVVVGVVLGVGVHPIDDPSPVMDLLLGDGTSGAALALRSSTRAVPMLVLGLALGAGALADALGGVRLAGRTSWRPLAVVAVGLLAVANLPVLTGHRLVDPALERDEDPPASWQEATAALDAGDTAARVLQLPGQEFGAFRWGYTVDPPLPGMTAKPMVTRDLLPLGSAAAMDLLYALDDRFQSGTIEPEAIAPLARLLGADTLWLTERRRLRPLPHPAPGDRPRPRARRGRYGTTAVLRRAHRQRARHLDDRRAVRLGSPRRRLDPAGRPRPDRRLRSGRAGEGRRRARRGQRRRHRRRRGRRAPRRPRADPLQRLWDDGRRRDRRHRHQPRPCPPLARLAGRRRVHRGRPAGVSGRPPRGPGRRAPARLRRRRRRTDRRRAGRSGAGAGDGVRRAVRLPTGGPPVHGRGRRPGDGLGRRRPV